MYRTNIYFVVAIIFFITVSCDSKREVDDEKRFPFMRVELSEEARARDLVGRLTLQEKILQLFNNAPAINRLGIPEYNWWNESLHGVARAGKATVFPQAIGLASTFNEELMYNIATVISDEARAKHHHFIRNGIRSNYTGLTFWSPNINIFRDPRWGRGQETYGEDPYLTGRMAVNYINGLQGDHPRYLKTIATLKHYAVHSGPEATRHTDNIFVNDRDLNQTYLPAFKMAMEETDVQSVMCAYNRFRDKPCCGSDLLLQRKLREEYGFEGYVVTDCGALGDFYRETAHDLVDRPAKALGWALASGTDLNCELNGDVTSDDILEAINIGMVNEADINQALTRLFMARIKLGMFDPPSIVPFTSIPMERVGHEEHLELAHEASMQSLVLLKNNGILPLKENTKVALIGPNAHNEDVLLGNYNGIPIESITPFEGLEKRIGKERLTYTPGSALVDGYYGNMTLVPSDVLFHKEGNKLRSGIRGRYFKNLEMSGDPDLERVDSQIDFVWEKSPVSGLFEERFVVEWEGVLKPDVAGEYQFRVSSLYGQSSIYVNEEKIDSKFVKLGTEGTNKIRILYKMNPNSFGGNAVTPEARLYWVRKDVDYEIQALEAAEKADVIIFCGGISPRLEGEEMGIDINGFFGGDRTDLKLPVVQSELLRRLHATGKPIVYVNFSGSAIALNWEDQNLDALVQAFYPGEATGKALAGLLFGDYSPSGKLPVTFYRSVEDLPEFDDYQMKGRTYRYFDQEVLYHFGHGLSYTDFEYLDFRVEKPTVLLGQSVDVSISVKNVGKMDGYHVVQLYLSDEQATVPVPITSLVGLKKIFLKKGETKLVNIRISNDQMSIIDSNNNRVVEPGEFRLMLNGWGKEVPTVQLSLED